MRHLSESESSSEFGLSSDEIEQHQVMNGENENNEDQMLDGLYNEDTEFDLLGQQINSIQNGQISDKPRMFLMPNQSASKKIHLNN